MRIRKSYKKQIIGAVAVFMAFVALFMAVPKNANLVYADAGGGGGNTSGCKPSYDKYGGCYSAANGFFWIKMPAASDDMLFSSLGFGYLRAAVRDGAARSHVTSCLTNGGSAYMLVTRMHLSNGADNGVGGGMLLSEAWNHRVDYDGGSLPAGATPVSWADAEAKYMEHADSYRAQGFDWASGSELDWFCEEAGPPSSKPKSDPTPPPDPPTNCGAYGSAEKADTRTRIAVQNMSLDGTYGPKYSDGSAREWRNTGGRSGLTADTLWTPESGSAETLAKHGDTIRFYHSICMAVRYGRWAPNQGTWGSTQSHTAKYYLPTSHAHIGASPSNYLFDDLSIVNNVNNQIANVDKQDKKLFYDAGVGTSVNPDGDAIDLLQPTQSYSKYDCMNVAQYAARDPFKAGGYQIPGFVSGQSCNSASSTNISNATGTTIQQWHTFNSLKMWEIHSHTDVNSCGCGQHGAYRTNYEAYSFEAAWSGGRLGKHKTWYCRDEGKTTLDCEYVCFAGYDEYHNCKAAKKPTKVQYNYGDGHDKYLYKSMYKDYGNKKKTATVYIPYNYNTQVSSTIDTGSVTFQGGSIHSSFNWAVLPRTNNRTSSFPYATTTPSSTKVRFIEFLYAPGNKSVSGNSFSASDPCSYYAGKGAQQCGTIDQVNGVQNPAGMYTGSTDSRAYTRLIPDDNEYIGYKYCVAVGFWPADSHDGSSNELWQQKSGGLGGAMDAGQYWNISGASCRTIAKKPNFQVWNGSVYTEGSIKTSYTKKMANQPFHQNYNNNATTLFGSWADYAIVAKGENRGMASGAMLGYDDSRYDLSGGGQLTTSMSAQILAPETVANTTDPTGHSNVGADSAIKTNLQRLKSRYSEKAASFANYSSSKTIKTAKTGMQYVYVTGNVKLSELGIASNSYPNQTTFKDGSGNIVKGLATDKKSDNTLVIYATGTVTIDRNICYGSSCGSDSSKLITYATGTSTNESSALPQVLIFANNIDITERATRVDAWLVADAGTINTCSGHKFGDSGSGLVGLEANDARMDYISYGNCDKTLVVNGPVYANNLKLMRTAGAYHGFGPTSSLSDPRYRSVGGNRDSADKNKGSVAPAEIFNLRADTYIWAYNQAQRYSEAVVTYTRELAPRY